MDNTHDRPAAHQGGGAGTAATTTTPRLAIGARVRSADGHEIGQVDGLIVDPYTHLIRAVVVRRGLILHHDVEIAISAIAGGTEAELRLRLTAEQVRALPEFVEARYAAPPTGFVPPGEYVRDNLLWPIGEPLLPPPPLRRNETAVRWYMNNSEITEGSDVISSDGHKIGEVHAVTVEPSTGRPLSLVVRRGLLFSREIELPADLIRDVGERVVYIDLDAQAARDYAQARAALHPSWAH
jgi:uncharacterized protein YrrD